MPYGMPAMFYTADREGRRLFLRDVLRLRRADAGEARLIAHRRDRRPGGRSGDRARMPGGVVAELDRHRDRRVYVDSPASPG